MTTPPGPADSPRGPSSPARGRRLGVDVGTVRIGVACSDPDGILATPVETVRRDRSGAHLDRLARLVREFGAVEVVVGLPRTMRNRTGPAARDASDVADALAKRIAPVPVRLADERLSTVSAHRALREAGVHTRRHRPVVDQVAAVTILQTWLDRHRGSPQAGSATSRGVQDG